VNLIILNEFYNFLFTIIRNYHAIGTYSINMNSGNERLNHYKKGSVLTMAIIICCINLRKNIIIKLIQTGKSLRLTFQQHYGLRCALKLKK